MKIIGRDGWPDLLYYTRTPDIREAFHEANRVLGSCPDRSEYLAVVWVPEPGAFCGDQIDAFAKDAKAGRVKNETSRKDQFYFSSKPWKQTVSHFLSPSINRKPHIDGKVEKTVLADGQYEINFYTSTRRRCVVYEKGLGGIVIPVRLRAEDICETPFNKEISIFTLSNKCLAANQENMWMVPTPGAVFFNHYGPIEHRLGHAEVDLASRLTDIQKRRGSWVVREIQAWDYSA